MKKYVLALALAAAAAATACSQPASAAEPNAAGDIPDTQVFVTYSGPGYSVLVPEGWARTQQGSAVTFRANANSELIDVRPSTERIDPRKRFHAAGAIGIKRGTLGTTPATVSTFRSRSNPDPVTGKAVALDNELYTATRNGRTVMLVLSAPAGADNADQWKKIAGSFRWK